MKITLTRYDVMGILCDHFDIPYITAGSAKQVTVTEPERDEVYWEGNPEIKKEN